MCKSFKIRSDNHVNDLTFVGKSVAYGTERRNNTQTDSRYSSYELFETESGKYVLVDEYTTHWQGEDGSRKAFIFDSINDVKGFIVDDRDSVPEWQKEFLDDCGIFLVKEI